MVFWGHAPNSQTRLPDMKMAMEKLDMLVIIDPYPTMSAVLSDRTDNVYLLPACTQFETYGSVTASNRSLQWREKVIEPSFDSLPDHTIIYKFAKKLGFDSVTKNSMDAVSDRDYIIDFAYSNTMTMMHLSRITSPPYPHVYTYLPIPPS